MTQRVQVRCDACATWLDIDDYEYTDGEIEQAGWKEDPSVSDTHYCGKCWKQAIDNGEFGDE